MGAVLSTLAAILVGGSVAAVTVVGVVSSQTSEPERSPADVSQPVVEYGSNG